MNDFKIQLPLYHQVNLNSPDFLMFPNKSDSNFKKAAVCVLIYKKNSTFYIGMIKRNTYKGVHSKQIGFAGGKLEPSDASLWEATKREVLEEIGLTIQDEHLIGKLNDITISVSNFMVRPYIVYYPKSLELTLDKREVKHFVEFPISFLFDKKRRSSKAIKTADNRNIKANILQLKDDYIWGASYIILDNLITYINKTKSIYFS